MAEPEALIADEMIAGRRADVRGRLPDDMPRWMANLIVAIDTINLWAGRLAAWLIAPLMFVVVYEVLARYLFTSPTAWAYDLSRMLCGGAFILGSAYALSKGIHIRADFMYRKWPVKVQGWVDTVLYLVFYFPSMLIFMYVATEWAWISVSRAERGMDTAWMPLLGPVKSTLPLGIALLILQGFSELFKAIHAARKGRWPQ
jgi:TRAP-type mannitol/chloroaromatic compound transport system permease small subunit